MLPEIFWSANDCACKPATEVLRASKIPITSSPNSIRAASRFAKPRPQSKEDVASTMPRYKASLYQILEWKCPGPVTGAQLPGGQQLPGRRRRSGRRWRGRMEDHCKA